MKDKNQKVINIIIDDEKQAINMAMTDEVRKVDIEYVIMTLIDWLQTNE